ncbi:MAG: FMN-binding protein [Elusimicrobiota bacterium]
MSEKSNSLKMLLILGAVCLLSALALSYTHNLTEQKIAENRQIIIEKAVFKVIPDISKYEKIMDNPTIYKGMKKGEVKGYAVISQGMGFQGNIKLMIGMGPQIDTVTGVEILESVETPGLGDRIKTKDFLSQFRKKDIPKSGEIKVDAITGATVSSEAVQRIVNKGIENAQRIY